MSRYARQIALPNFGLKGQAAVEQAHVLVIGAGGLGAPVLQYLVGAGVGHITLVDADHVDESNLHRQTLFRISDIGLSKAEQAAKHMAALNPETVITPHVARFDPANAADLMDGIDLVLDCADSFAASYIASDICVAQNVPLIHASVTGMSGYCGAFCAGAPSLRALFPDLPSRMGSCALDGVLGPCVGVIGSLQAQMAISVLIGSDPSPLGQLVTYDGSAMRFGGFRFDRAPEPEKCPVFIGETEVCATDFVIDLRAVDEAGPQITAIRSNVDQITNTVTNMTNTVPDMPNRLVLACRSGLRAWNAADRIEDIWKGEIALIALGE